MPLNSECIIGHLSVSSLNVCKYDKPAGLVPRKAVSTMLYDIVVGDFDTFYVCEGSSGLTRIIATLQTLCTFLSVVSCHPREKVTSIPQPEFTGFAFFFLHHSLQAEAPGDNCKKSGRTYPS